MTEEIKAYCMKCKAERTIQNVQIVTTKNGRPAANGACPVCGTKMFKFLPSSYKDMIVFGLLLAILLFRPAGLFGMPLNKRV